MKILDVDFSWHDAMVVVEQRHILTFTSSYEV